MARVSITPENFVFDLLSDDQKDSYELYKQQLMTHMISKGKSASEIPEKAFIAGWLKQNQGAEYPEKQSDAGDLEEFMSDFDPALVTPGSKNPPGSGDNKNDDKDPVKVAAEKEAKRKADELAAKESQDRLSAKLVEEAAAKAREAAAAEEVRKLQEEQERAKLLAAEKLKKFADFVMDTPLAKAKLSEMEEFKDGKDMGLKAAATKMRMAQQEYIAEFSKVLRPMKAGDIDMDLIHWDSKHGELILSICWYVCVNGPVGVGKPTRFGNLPGTYSIKDVFEDADYPEPITNSMWRKFCKKLVDHIDISAVEVKQGRMMQLYGKLWPHCDADMVTQNEFKARRKEKYLELHGDAFEGNM